METLFARSESTYDEANWGRVHHQVHVSVPGNGFADEGGVDVVSYDFVSELPRYNNEVTSTSKETLQADGENKWQELVLMNQVLAAVDVVKHRCCCSTNSDIRTLPAAWRGWKSCRTVPRR